MAESLKTRGLIDDAGLKEIDARALEQFNAAVEIAKREPPPTLQELTTDVFA